MERNSAERGLLVTFVLVFCAFTVGFTLFGTWAYWEKPFCRSGKGDGEGIYASTLSERVAVCAESGVVYGLLAGAVCGVGIAAMRDRKKSPTT